MSGLVRSTPVTRGVGKRVVPGIGAGDSEVESLVPISAVIVTSAGSVAGIGLSDGSGIYVIEGGTGDSCIGVAVGIAVGTGFGVGIIVGFEIGDSVGTGVGFQVGFGVTDG